MKFCQKNNAYFLGIIKVVFACSVFIVAVLLLLTKSYIITNYEIIFEKYEPKWTGIFSLYIYCKTLDYYLIITAYKFLILKVKHKLYFCLLSSYFKMALYIKYKEAKSCYGMVALSTIKL